MTQLTEPAESTIRAEVITFTSGIDGTEQRAAVCGPATATGPLPLLVELIPGSIHNLERTLDSGQRHLDLVGTPAVWLRPGGRGPGTVFQGYGEIDVLEAIEAVAARYAIDRDRISLYGSSMGGAGTWYLATHQPDRFAAIAPFAGYNDYRLWRRPGGMTFPLMPWEEPSWMARSAIFLLENLRHTGVWIVHGEWDRAVGGGVDVAHARQSAARLRELDIPHRYSELPATGHNASGAAASTTLLRDVLQWLVAQRRPASPAEMTHTTYELRHASAHWLSIQQLTRYGDTPGRITARTSGQTDGDTRNTTGSDATVNTERGTDSDASSNADYGVAPETGGEATTDTGSKAAHEVEIHTENVRHLALGPVPQAGPQTRLRVDGTLVAGADLRQRTGVRRTDVGQWQVAPATPPATEKRPGLSGPLGDLFGRGTVLVAGTLGSAAESHFLAECARDASRFFRTWNGGVHRGGIAGDSWVDLPVLTDEAYRHSSHQSDDDLRNVIAYGTPTTSTLLAEYATALGLEVAPGLVRLQHREWRGQQPTIIAVLPHPGGGDRYLAIHSGATPDAITHGAHLHLQLLPDYLVYDGNNVLEWGYFDHAWRLPDPPRQR